MFCEHLIQGTTLGRQESLLYRIVPGLQSRQEHRPAPQLREVEGKSFGYKQEALYASGKNAWWKTHPKTDPWEGSLAKRNSEEVTWALEARLKVWFSSH